MCTPSIKWYSCIHSVDIVLWNCTVRLYSVEGRTSLYCTVYCVNLYIFTLYSEEGKNKFTLYSVLFLTTRLDCTLRRGRTSLQFARIFWATCSRGVGPHPSTGRKSRRRTASQVVGVVGQVVGVVGQVLGVVRQYKKLPPSRKSRTGTKSWRPSTLTRN